MRTMENGSHGLGKRGPCVDLRPGKDKGHNTKTTDKKRRRRLGGNTRAWGVEGGAGGGVAVLDLQRR